MEKVRRDWINNELESMAKLLNVGTERWIKDESGDSHSIDGDIGLSIHTPDRQTLYQLFEITGTSGGQNIIGASYCLSGREMWYALRLANGVLRKYKKSLKERLDELGFKGDMELPL